MEKLIIGSHVSFTKEKGLLGSTEEALSYGSTTFMFYTGAPQNTFRGKIDQELTKQARKLMEKSNINIDDIIVHAPYIVNLANDKDEDKFNFAVNFLKQEVKRVKQLGVKKIVLHPGSHVGLGETKGLENIIKGLNVVLDEEEGPIICLETMAGKGTELGYNFKQLKTIIDGVKNNHRLMVCMDTCHMNDAGYDINDFDKLLDEFDQIIGEEKIGCIHINDSKNEKGAHKDRHENIGLGTIGFESIINIVYNPRLKKVSKILETPYISVKDGDKDRSYPPYKFEIEMIKNKKYNKNFLNEIRNYYK